MPSTPFQRTAGKSTFAFDLPNAPQASPSSSGAFNGARVVGGDSQAGVERASPMTFVNPADDHIPEFVRQAMEPYIQQKQQEAAVQGATDLLAGRTIQDIAKGDSGISRIFGPTAYHKGAAAFAATDAWAKAKSDLLNNPDLQQMSPDQTGKYLAEQYRGLQTGDPVTDGLLNATIMQDHGPLVAALTAKQQAYAASTAALEHSNYLDHEAQNVGQLRGTLDLSSPSGQAAYAQATNTFAANLFTTPHGMMPEVHQKVVAGVARNLLSSNNSADVATFEGLKDRGLYKLMTDEQQVALDTAYRGAANRGLGNAYADPTVAAAKDFYTNLALNGGYFQQGKNGGRTFVHVNEADIRTAAEHVNGLAAKVSGITGVPLLSPSDVESDVARLQGTQKEAVLRAQSKQDQIELENYRHGLTQADKAAEAEEKIKIAKGALVSGQLGASQASGLVDGTAAKQVYTDAYNRGDYQSLFRDFQHYSKVDDGLVTLATSGIENSLGGNQFTKGAQHDMQEFSKREAISKPWASATMGKYGPKAQRYADILNAGTATPEEAWASSFAMPDPPGKAFWPTGVKDKDARADMLSGVRSQDSGWFSNGLVPLSSSGQQSLVDYLAPAVANRSSTSGRDRVQATHDELTERFGNATVERYGGIWWPNNRAATHLSTLMGVPADKADAVFGVVLRNKLAAVTGSSSTEGAVAARFGDDSNPHIAVTVPDSSGVERHATITLDELRAANKQFASTAQARAQLTSGIKVDLTSQMSDADRKANAQFKTNPDKDIGPAMLRAIDAVDTATPAGAASKALIGMYNLFRNGVDISGKSKTK